MLRSTTILLIISVLIMMSPAVMAQDDEIPTVAILRSGLSSSIRLADRAMLDMLHAYGFISDAERLVLEEEQDLYGEKLNIIWRNAGYDLPTTNIMVEEALDRGVDVMITVSTTVTQIAVNATRDMEDPPVIIFNIVSAPYSSGIADASCIKPDYVTGTSPSRSYESYLTLVVPQDPDISDVGALVNPSEPSSVESAKRITEAAESLGLTVHTASVATITDVNIATESLLGKGVEALVLGISATVNNSLSTVLKLSTDYGVPVYSVVPRRVFLGVTIALGFDDHYGQGVTAARMFIA